MEPPCRWPRCRLSRHCKAAEHSTSCSPMQDSSPAPASGQNGLKAGACPRGKSLAEHVRKLHPLQQNHAKWQVFCLSRVKRPASLLSSPSFFSLGENKLNSRLFFSLSPPTSYCFPETATSLLLKMISQKSACSSTGMLFFLLF